MKTLPMRIAKITRAAVISILTCSWALLCSILPVQAAAPKAPSNLSAVAVSTSQIDLSWKDNSHNETAFEIQRKNVTAGEAYRRIVRVPANTRTFSDTVGLTADTTYSYRVQGLGSGGVSAYSNEASATTASSGGGSEGDPVGFVGASITGNAIVGYELLGGTRFWPNVGTSYNGGGITAWASNLSDSSIYWSTFQASLNSFPTTKIIWYELATSTKAAATDTYDNAVVVINEIGRRLPGAIIYVSAQPDYTNGHVCDITGADGAARMQLIADQLVADGLALAGPLMGPLSESQTSDGCHANADGQTLMGLQLMEFFDPL